MPLHLSRRTRSTVFWTSIALVSLGWVIWRVTWVYGALTEELGKQLAMSVQLLGSGVQGWHATRISQAELVAGILGDSQATRERRFRIVGDRLSRREGYVEGWLLTGEGAVSLRGDPPPARLAIPTNPGLAAAPVVRCGSKLCIDFEAAVPAANDSLVAAGIVALRIPAEDSLFSMLRPPRKELRERTLIVAPYDGSADSVVVLASRGNSGPSLAGKVLSRAAIPPAVQAAMGDGPRHGRGTGMAGIDAIYAVGRAPGTPWVIVRELDTKPLHHQINIQLLIEEVLIVGLFVALVFIIRNRVRVSRQRRKDEITTLRADFVASASHELRTPLAQIRMFAELLRKGSLRNAEESERALRIIEKEASRLTILVDNILNYARLRRRTEEQSLRTPIPADVGVDVAQTLEAFAPLALERGVHVVSAVEGKPLALMDSLALRQVLINFLENATKYGPRGQTVTIGARHEGSMVRVWVDDEGPGVPAAERERVWRAFFRGTRAEESGQGGSGIGLAVVRDLVLLTGGRVSVEDVPGGGARFVAEIPSAVVPSREPELAGA